MERIGVIGLGRMGSALAVRLSAQCAQVTGWTRSGLSTTRAAEMGVAAASDIPELVAQSDIILTSLLDDAAVASVLDALLRCDLSGRLILETSTVVPTLLTERLPEFERRGADVMDTPISGGPEMVEAGTCGVFTGGSGAVYGRALPVLHGFAGRVFHVGPLGTGLAMKTVNNAMMQVYVLALRELLPVAQRAGLSLETAMTILAGGPAGLPMVRDRLPKIMGEDPEVGFPISAILKDNHVFRQVAAAYGVETPLLALAGQDLAAAVEAGLADIDPAHLIAEAYTRD